MKEGDPVQIRMTLAGGFNPIVVWVSGYTFVAEHPSSTWRHVGHPLIEVKESSEDCSQLLSPHDVRPEPEEV